MASTLLDISGKPSLFEVEIFDTIHQAVSQLGIPFLVVGASARDLVLHHAHGVEIIRASRDIDFAVQVESWGAYLGQHHPARSLKSTPLGSVRNPASLKVFFGVQRQLDHSLQQLVG
jgi:predicted nucleotidyltransferase